MKEYFNILKYGFRNVYNKKLKSYSFKRGKGSVKERLADFINNIPTDTIIVCVGLKQIKYYAGIENPAEFVLDLLQKKFKNIISPAFTGSVAKTEFFDVKNTPSDHGPFSNILLKMADYRTPSPFRSWSVKGPIAKEIEQLQYENDFAPNGIFEFIYKNNISTLNIGTTDIRPALIHYVEYFKNVPYLKVEKKTIKVRDVDGNIRNTVTTKVGYKMNYKFNRDKIEKDLIQNNLIQSKNFNGICMRYIPGDEHFHYFIARLSDDPYYLIN